MHKVSKGKKLGDSETKKRDRVTDRDVESRDQNDYRQYLTMPQAARIDGDRNYSQGLSFLNLKTVTSISTTRVSTTVACLFKIGCAFGVSVLDPY